MRCLCRLCRLGRTFANLLMFGSSAPRVLSVLDDFDVPIACLLYRCPALYGSVTSTTGLIFGITAENVPLVEVQHCSLKDISCYTIILI